MYNIWTHSEHTRESKVCVPIVVGTVYYADGYLVLCCLVWSLCVEWHLQICGCLRLLGYEQCGWNQTSELTAAAAAAETGAGTGKLGDRRYAQHHIDNTDNRSYRVF